MAEVSPYRFGLPKLDSWQRAQLSRIERHCRIMNGIPVEAAGYVDDLVAMRLVRRDRRAVHITQRGIDALREGQS